MLVLFCSFGLFVVCAMLPSIFDCTIVLLEQAAADHGEGVVLAILQGLQKAHAVRCESTKHGLFVKLLYAKSAVGRKAEAPSRQTIVLVDMLSSITTANNRRVPPQPSQPPPTPPCGQTNGVDS